MDASLNLSLVTSLHLRHTISKLGLCEVVLTYAQPHLCHIIYFVVAVGIQHGQSDWVGVEVSVLGLILVEVLLS